MSKFTSLTKRIIAAMAAGTLLIAMPLAGCDGTKDENSSETSSQSKNSKDESALDDNIVVTSKNFKISYPVMQYLFNYMFQNFCNTYGTSYFDTSVDLKEQYYNEEEKITWYDYFLETTKNYLTQIIVFAEGGKENGLELTDSDLETLEQNFSEMESVASESSKTLEEYIAELYGDNVTKADIEEIQQMTVLAQDYNNYLMDNFVYTDNDYEEQYQTDKSKYNVVDYCAYYFPYNTDSESSEDIETAKAEAKENADALANAKNQKEFDEYLTKYLKDNPSLVSIPSSTDESSVTEAAFNAGLSAAIDATHNYGKEYDDSNECYKWIFSEDRKENEITVIDENNAYNVILVTKPSYRDESETKSVRHILISVSNTDANDEDAAAAADTAAKEKAEQVYQEWKDGDKTEATFAELAEKYSEDPGSVSNGGLYSNVPENYMVAEFNDWIFDSNRKVGDSDIVKTQFGYHIMYFVGDGLKTWQVNVDNDLRQNDISEKYEEMKKTYTVEFDDDTIKKMTLKMPESAE